MGKWPLTFLRPKKVPKNTQKCRFYPIFDPFYPIFHKSYWPFLFSKSGQKVGKWPQNGHFFTKLTRQFPKILNKKWAGGQKSGQMAKSVFQKWAVNLPYFCKKNSPSFTRAILFPVRFLLVYR